MDLDVQRAVTVLDALQSVALLDLAEEKFGVDGDLEVAESVEVVDVKSFLGESPF